MITEDKDKIDAVIRGSMVCRVAVCVQDRPYVVPLNFGYEDGCLYFHGMREKGRLAESLRQNSNVCFVMDTDHEPVPAEEACRWDMKYRSVIGFGTASFVTDPKEKQRAFNALMRQVSDPSTHSYPDGVSKKTVVIRVDITSMTAKENGYD